MKAKSIECSIFEESQFIYSCHCVACIELNTMATIIKKIKMSDYHVLGKMPMMVWHSDN